MANWTRACATDDIEPEDLIRFDHDGRSFVVIRSPEDDSYCTDGVCTHEHAHLCDGLVMDGFIECPRHNAHFDYRTGAAIRARRPASTSRPGRSRSKTARFSSGSEA